MRQFAGRLLLLIVVVLLIFGIYRLITVEPLKPQAIFGGDTPLWLAGGDRAGDSRPYSKAWLQAAASEGAAGVRLPLYLTRDGHLVAAAGDELTGLATDDSRISSLTLAELAAATNSSPASFRTLPEILAHYPDWVILAELRVPERRAVDALLAAARQSGAGDRLIAWVDDQAEAEYLRAQMPDLATAFTANEQEAFLTTRRFGLGSFYRPPASVLVIDAASASPGLVRSARRLGMHVILLGAGGEDAARRAAGDDLDAFVAP